MCYNVFVVETWKSLIGERNAMAEKKLVIRPHKFGGETAVISLRLPKEMLAVIDQVATDTGRTRNEILVMSMEFALEHMEINDN